MAADRITLANNEKRTGQVDTCSVLNNQKKPPDYPNLEEKKRL